MPPLIHLNSSNLRGPEITQLIPNFINNSYPNTFPLYGRAVFNITPFSVVEKKLYLKEFGCSYNIFSFNESFNNTLKYFNITTNSLVVYDFPITNFTSIPQFITYLNTNCPDLNFVWNDPSLVFDNTSGKVTINHTAGDDFYLIFDQKSIGRLLGFPLGTTQNVISPNTITSIYSVTTQSIGTIYMNLNIANNNLSNMGQGFTFVITLDSNFNFNDLVRIYENSYFEQSVNNITTQFNQIIVSFTDSYGNWVPLNSLYTITLELV